jgi:undecaprenyl diphosphate synthase
MSSVGADTPPLRHVIVAGGTAVEWEATSAERWSVLVDELGKVADHVGASWLTLRPFGGERVAGVSVADGHVGGCLVHVDARVDGRAALAEAVDRLRTDGIAITEASIAAAMNAPAEADPDLVVVLGAAHSLPHSLVWELAYSELVFLEVAWAQLSAAHLIEAIDSFAHRHRRFGGID